MRPLTGWTDAIGPILAGDELTQLIGDAQCPNGAICRIYAARLIVRSVRRNPLVGNAKYARGPTLQAELLAQIKATHIGVLDDFLRAAFGQDLT